MREILKQNKMKNLKQIPILVTLIISLLLFTNCNNDDQSIKEDKLLQISQFKELGEIHNAFLDNTNKKFKIENEEKSLSKAINSINDFNTDYAKNVDYFKENNSQSTNIFNASKYFVISKWFEQYLFKDKEALSKRMTEKDLVAISSIAGIRGSRIAPAYNASKAYQINYLEGLRQKATKTKKPIYVTDIRPGFVDTDMAKGEGQFWAAPKEKAARQIVGIIKKKKGIGYVTKKWWIIAKLLRLIPNGLYKKI